jgi:hypothetical protein
MVGGMIGRRLPDVSTEEYFGWDSLNLQPGDYVKLHGGKFWGARAPNGDAGTLRTHRIVEHEDGTITVSPSIQMETGQRWHGYLERGVWRSC